MYWYLYLVYFHEHWKSHEIKRIFLAQGNMLFFCSFHSICLARFQSLLWKHFIVFEICFLLQPLMADTWPRKSRMKLPTAAKISHNISIFGFINKNIYERTKMSFHPFDGSHAKQLQTGKFQELNCQRSLGSILEFIISDSYFISLYACIDMDISIYIHINFMHIWLWNMNLIW